MNWLRFRLTPMPLGEQVDDVDRVSRERSQRCEVDLEALGVEERHGQCPRGEIPYHLLDHLVAVADPEADSGQAVCRYPLPERLDIPPAHVGEMEVIEQGGYAERQEGRPVDLLA